MNICITGTTGFIGGALVKHFAKKGFNVYACGRKEDRGYFTQYNNVSYIQRDLQDVFPDIQLLQSFDVFIHSAGNVSYTQAKNSIIRDNVLSLDNFLPFIPHGCHFVYISSSSVYQGYYGKIHIDEDIFPQRLVNTYSLSKFLAEQKINTRSEQQQHKKLTIIRPRAVYGDGDTTLVPKILRNQIFGNLLLPGNGKNKTSLTEIHYLCKNLEMYIVEERYGKYNMSSEVQTYQGIFSKLVREQNLKGIIYIPIWIFKLLRLFNKSKYSYIIDTFGYDKILI